ncbi:hypothetical protein GQ55_9G070700 [Panicum hallii var. hallii]|uniref:Uncharacterized protein n=1 Tax=Panicum hallii var. hallii TaxID=1504633 RepID=A0A2T7C0I9_9POAL|nr:hypothetical protein GQ55_9G070700 [Panicum hallii var. hallii]
MPCADPATSVLVLLGGLAWGGAAARAALRDPRLAPGRGGRTGGRRRHPARYPARDPSRRPDPRWPVRGTAALLLGQEDGGGAWSSRARRLPWPFDGPIQRPLLFRATWHAVLPENGPGRDAVSCFRDCVPLLWHVKYFTRLELDLRLPQKHILPL